MQNYTAEIITNKSKFEHITPDLKDLHWLSILDRIIFKVFNGHSLEYLSI